MKTLLVLTISFSVLVMAAPPESSPARDVKRPGRFDRVRHFGKSLVGRGALLGAGASTATGEVTNSPHEWGRGPLGMAKRFGSGLATGAVEKTIEHGVGAALHEEHRGYVRADEPGFMPKFKSAAEQTFWTKHKGSEKNYPAYGRFSGAFGAGFVSRLWQPARLRTVGSGVATGGIIIGSEFGMNMAREYFPRHKKESTTAHR